MSNKYQEDMEINKDALDLEWLNQPMLFMSYSEKQAKAKKRLMEVHEELKVTRSKLVKEAKEKGYTNAVQQEAYYRDHKKHKRKKQEMIGAEFECNILTSAVFALQQRKTALENLVKLHGQNYFSTPSVKTENDEDYEKTARKREVKKKIKKKRRTK